MRAILQYLSDAWHAVNTLGVYADNDWDRLLALGYTPESASGFVWRAPQVVPALQPSASGWSVFSIGLLALANGRQMALPAAGWMLLAQATAVQSVSFTAGWTAPFLPEGPFHSTMARQMTLMDDDSLITVFDTTSVGYQGAGICRFAADGSLLWSRQLLGSAVQDSALSVSRVDSDHVIALYRIEQARYLLMKVTLAGEIVFARATAIGEVTPIFPAWVSQRSNGHLIIVSAVRGEIAAAAEFSSNRFGFSVIETDSEAGVVLQARLFSEAERDFFISSSALCKNGDLLVLGEQGSSPRRAAFIRINVDSFEISIANVYAIDLPSLTSFRFFNFVELDNEEIHVQAIVRGQSASAYWLKMSAEGDLLLSTHIQSPEAIPMAYSIVANASDRLLMSGVLEADDSNKPSHGLISEWQITPEGWQLSWAKRLTELEQGSPAGYTTFRAIDIFNNEEIVAVGESRRLSGRTPSVFALATLRWRLHDMPSALCLDTHDLTLASAPALNRSLLNLSIDQANYLFSPINYQLTDLALVPQVTCPPGMFNESETDSSSFPLAETEVASPESSEGVNSTDSLGTEEIAIIGGLTGGVALMLLGAMLAWLYRRRQQTRVASNESISLNDAVLYMSEQDLVIGQRLGRGGFGAVYFGTYQSRTVAVKRVTELSETRLEELRQEAKLMQRLKSQFIIEFIGIAVGDSGYSIVMEYAPAGSVFDWLRSEQEIAFAQTVKVALQAAQGLEFLHDQNVLHRDIKSMNVLLMQDGSAKLADFGLSKESKTLPNSQLGHGVGTLQWMAPELLCGEAPTLDTDIYAFAIFMWELATRELPYRDIPLASLAVQVIQGLRPSPPSEAPYRLAELMRHSWLAQASQRPSASQLVSVLASEALSPR